MFAYYFTAPDIVLHSTGLISPEDIMYNCRIPFDKAHRKSKLLKYSLTERKTVLEKILKSNFDEYIEYHKEKEYRIK